MLPFVEVPCKTLKELPRNVGGNILALAAVNKKWSRLPGDVRNVVAQNMGRATPSAMAFKKAFQKNVYSRPSERWITAERTRVREGEVWLCSDYDWKKEYFWNIDCETGHVYQYWQARLIGRAQKRKRTLT